MALLLRIVCCKNWLEYECCIYMYSGQLLDLNINHACMACNDEFCLLVWYYIYIYKTLSCCSFCGRKCLLSEISGNKLDTWISSCCHWNWFNLHIMTMLYLFLAEKGIGIRYIIHEVGALEYHWERILQPWTNRFLNSVVASFGIQVSETKNQVHIIQTKSQWLLIPDLNILMLGN